MNQRADKVEVTVEEVKDSAPSEQPGRPSVVIETEATVDGEVRDTSIEVRDADAPAVAAALLNADTGRAPASADLPIAVQCLAAGVMPAANPGQVRLHLQFESGQVLPIEMSHDAAMALSRALIQHAGTR
ncbi:MAG: hypothetical protein H7Y61_06150 [Rhizobiales bacterium]|nr:hypothetical protein [Rhizobacter sp.]